MTRVFLIHGWGGSPGKDWLPWFIPTLTEKGYEVIAPQMPETDNPQIELWVNKLSELVGQARESDILVGHSIGCQAILRFLEKLPHGQKVNKVILVAPWFELTNLENEAAWQIADPWIKTPISFQKIISHANSFTTIFSTNDSWVPLDINLQLFKERLNPKIIILKNRGHFTKEEGVTSIPELLNLI